MVDYAQLLNLDTSKLTAAAEAAGGVSGAMSARGGEVDSAARIPTGMWDGADAGAASGLLSPMSSPLFDVSDSANRSRGVMEELVTALEDAKQKLLDARHMAIAGGLTVDADGTIHVPVVNDPAEAARLNELARQAREMIDLAIQIANQADEAAVGGLAAAGQGLARFLGLPINSPLGPEAWAPYGAGQALYRTGNLASWMANGRLGQFAPQLRNGQYLDPQTVSRARRFWAGARGQFVANNPANALQRAQWLATSKWAGRLGGGVGAITSGFTQYAEDARDPNMGGAERATRAVYRGAVQGGTTYGGGVLGASVGAGIGTMILPGVGTVVGGAIGGLIGGFAGNEAGDWAVDNTIDDVGNAAELVTENPGLVGGGLSRGVDQVTPW